jgi:hypothetical protein
MTSVILVRSGFHARPISAINALVGDAGFVARHGRLPTAADDQTERIAAHLAFAEHSNGASR